MRELARSGGVTSQVRAALEEELARVSAAVDQIGRDGRIEQRLGLALEAGHMGTWEWDLATGRVTWSAALERVHGIPEGSFGGTFQDYQRDIHPQDRARVLETISRSLELGQAHHLEYRIVRPDGAVRWLEASGRVWLDHGGTPIGMMGVCADVSDRKAAEIALRESKDWFSTTLDSIGDAVIACDSAGHVTYMNRIAEQLTAWTLVEAKGRRLEEIFCIHDGTTREPVESPVSKVIRSGQVVGLVDHTVLVRRDGSEIAVDDSAAPIRSERGEIVGVVMVFRDSTDKRQQDVRRAFIAEASTVLAGDLDYDRAISAVARLAVPRIADWCAVDLLGADGVIRRIAIAHADPDKVELGWALHHRYPPDPLAEHGVPQVLRTGEAELVNDLTHPLLAQIARDPEHLDLLCQLGLRSSMVVPVRIQAKVLGAVSFGTAESRRRLTEDDLQVAKELCTCAAIAMENARLFREAQSSKERAQRSSERLEILAAASQEFAEKSTGSAELVTTVARVVGDRLGDSCSVMLVDADGAAIQLAALHDMDPEAGDFLRALMERSPVRVGEGIAGRIIQANQPLLIPVVRREELEAWMKPEHRDWLDRFAFHSVVVAPLRARGAVIGVIMASRHRTKRSYTVEDRQLLEALADRAGVAVDNARLLEAERAAHARAERDREHAELFAGVLGHDLRNPLGAILSGAQLMQHLAADRPEVHKKAERIIAASARMGRMIEQLLDFTRVRSGGGLLVKPAATHLGQLCRQVVDEFESRAHAARIRVQSAGEMQGQWDPDRLAQALSNLIGNAVDHSPEGSEVLVDVDGASPEAVVIEVRNQGQVPPEVLPTVFQPFRGTAHVRERARGLGLGLFITEQIVQAHRGTIAIRSDDGTVRVTARLPRAPRAFSG